ncbi:MAG: acyltransferase [Clostridium sp.]
MGEKKRRLDEIQVLRAFAFIFVMMQHSLGSIPGNLSLPEGITLTGGFLYTFAEPAVPIFLFISGLTLTYSYKDKLDLGKYYKNRFLYLIIPYFIWSFINMRLHNPERVSNFIEETIAGNGAFHLWYMGMIIRMVLIFPVIIYIGRFINRRNKGIKILTFVGVFIGYHYVSAYQGTIQDFVGKILFGQPTDLQMRTISLSILFWSFYLILGVFAGFNYEGFRKNIIKYRYIVYGVFILMFMYKFQIKYNAVPYDRTYDILYRSSNIMFFYLVALKVMNFIKLREIFKFIGEYSYAAYMIHIFVLYKFIFGLQGLGITGSIVNAILACIGASLAAPMLIYIISFIPKSKFATGVNDNFNKLKIELNKKFELKI